MKIHKFSVSDSSNENNEKKYLSIVEHKAKKARLFVQRLKNFIEGKYLMCISDNCSVCVGAVLVA